MSQPVPDELLAPVIAYFPPRQVILFGSAARGEAGPDSDYDLLVILDDDTPREKLTPEAGFAARRGFKRAANVIPCRVSAFHEKSPIPGTVAHEAAHEGIVVHDRGSG